LQLYRRNQTALYRFALRMTGNTLGCGKKLVQMFFMTLMRDTKKYDGAAAHRSFFERVARIG